MCSPISPDDAPVGSARESCPLEQLEREICELAAHIAAATCRWLLLVAEFDQRGGWAEWGVTSCAHWLSWRCSIAPRSAREHVRVARALAVFPLVRDAFATGELSYSKVRAITRVASAKTEAALVELARHATGGQLDRLVRGYAGVLRANVEQAQRAHESRALTYEWKDDGTLVLQARLAAEEGAIVLSALEAAEEPSDTDEGDAPGPAVRRADALVAMARSGLTSGVAARSGGDPCEVVVHVDAASLAGDEVQGRSELERGPALAPETVRRLGCDAAVVRIVERDGEPLNVGRRTRTIPPALRRALRSRDHGCRFPGCSHSRFLHAHHIEHWARGGPTALTNLVQLCSRHHRLVHEGGFGVEHDGHGIVTFRCPDGRVIPCEPAQTKARGSRTIERRNREHGVVIGPRTCMPCSAGDRLDYGIAVEGLMARALAGT